MNEVKSCSDKNHKNSTSKYDKDAVPINMFKNNKTDILYQMCEDCRNLNKKYRKTHNTASRNRYNKYKIKYNKSIENNNDFMYCPNLGHLSCSIHPRNRVPKLLFRKYAEDPNSPLTTCCLDCRTKIKKRSTSLLHNKIAEIEKSGKLCCHTCAKEIEPSHKNYVTCESCLGKTLQNRKDLKNSIIFNIKMEIMNKYQSCCNKCHYVFITENNKTVTELETVLVDDIRYLEYHNNFYEAVDFIETHTNKIVFPILHFDHLSEKELRETGRLKPEEKFIPKKDIISHLASEIAIRTEINKCQLVCSKCHLLETIKREKGSILYRRFQREKLEHVNALKLNGCCMCGYKNEFLPRFFHFDHIDPKNKIACISVIVKNEIYSFEDLLNEIEKCRVLCQFCHQLHTLSQINYYN